MDSKLLVSIIIPCYNDAAYIEQAVKSANDQTYPYKEIIVVDDGSNAETKAVLKKLQPNITKLITHENQGQSTARNVGIKAANGDFVLVLDSDDYFEASFCEEAIAILQNSDEVKIVTSHLRRFTDSKTIDIFVPSGGDIATFVIKNGATGSAMFRKSDALSVNGYDETMRKGFEDWEFYIRLLAHGGITEVIPKPYLNYRVRANSTTSRANKVKEELLKYIYTKNRVVFLQHIDAFVSNLLDEIEKEEKQKNKIFKSIDYKLGALILKPFRFIKSLFR
ncbi:glycosyltransferase family 2 protein [Flavobacterium cyclinae]|uniref:glycosyltransferase family 2 protein n=1 Tax=Flavobacterium cyclinae TaxID=2895947 RepID=UPI001E5D65E3|nr:glycosyltransferase [Flavobacterium cyclinae]UGS20568.1 glycosyltransferase [Flavobacterium cyclinae]